MNYTMCVCVCMRTAKNLNLGLIQPELGCFSRSLVSSDLEIELDEDARKDLHFWISQMHLWNGRPITTPTAEVTIMSDASTSGWGASCGTSQTGGPWTLSDAHQHARANSSLSSSADGCNFSIHVSCCWSTISLPLHTWIPKEVHSQSSCQTWL